MGHKVSMTGMLFEAYGSTPFEKQVLLLALNKDWLFDHGSWSHQSWPVHHPQGYLSHPAMHSYSPSSSGSGVCRIRPGRTWGHSWITLGKNLKAHDPHSCLLSPALQSELHEEFLWSLTKKVKTEPSLKSFCPICKLHSKVESCSREAPFWDIAEGQGWSDNSPGGRTSSCAPGVCPRCLEGEMLRPGIRPDLWAVADARVGRSWSWIARYWETGDKKF